MREELNWDDIVAWVRRNAQARYYAFGLIGVGIMALGLWACLPAFAQDWTIQHASSCPANETGSHCVGHVQLKVLQKVAVPVETAESSYLCALTLARTNSDTPWRTVVISELHSDEIYREVPVGGTVHATVWQGEVTTIETPAGTKDQIGADPRAIGLVMFGLAYIGAMLIAWNTLAYKLLRMRRPIAFKRQEIGVTLGWAISSIIPVAMLIFALPGTSLFLFLLCFSAPIGMYRVRSRYVPPARP